MNMSTLQTHRVGPSCFWCEEHLPLHLRASDSTISFYWRFWHSGALKRSIEAPLFSVAFFWKIVTRSDTYPTEKLTGTFLKGSLLIFGQLVALDAGRMRLEGAAAGSTSCRSTGWVDHDKTTGRCMWQRLWRSLTAVAMLMRSEYIGCRKCPLTCPSEPFSFVLRTLEIWWNIEHRPFTWSTHKFKPYWFFAAERTCSSWWQMHVLHRSIVSPMFHSVTVHDAYRRLEDLPISLRLGVFCFWLQQGQRVTQVLLPFSTWTCLVSLWFLCCWLLHPQECSVASAGHSFIP